MLYIGHRAHALTLAALRTAMPAPPSDAAFSDAPPLPNWLADAFPFRRRRFHNGEHTIHFVDDGNGPAVLLQHGNPTWSFLWRHVIRRLLAENIRVIAPDLVGLGLSTKPRDPNVHTLDLHGRQLVDLVRALNPERLVVAGQDWGGPITGLIAARTDAVVRGAVFANTALRAPTSPPRTTAFHRLSNWPVISDVLFRGLNLPVRFMHRVQGAPESLDATARRAYRYPLRRWRDRAAPLALARMVPTRLDHPTVHTLQEVDAWARAFGGPVRLVWGTRDPILGPALSGMRDLFSDPPVTATDAGHFLQEEVPDVLADAILTVVAEAIPAPPHSD